MEASQTQKSNLLRIAAIHRTAAIHPEAKIAKHVKIGPFTTIGKNVELLPGTEIGPHVVIKGPTIIGKNNHIYHGTVIGAISDPEKTPEPGQIIIGDNNIIRENVTIYQGTKDKNTWIGSNNFIMAYCNITEDCCLGENIIISNAVNLDSNVVIEDQAVIAGLSSVHQGVRIGRIAMVGAHSDVREDVPPYILVDGHPARGKQINVIGLRRNGFKPELRKEIKMIFKILYRSRLEIGESIIRINKEFKKSSEIDYFIKFLVDVNKGICR